MAQQRADGAHHRPRREVSHDLRRRIGLVAFEAPVRMRGDETNGRLVHVDVEEGTDIAMTDDSMDHSGIASTMDQFDRHLRWPRRHRLCSANAA